MKEKILFSWSGGKDSALALYEIQQKGNYEIVSLLTTVTEDYGRVSMHGVRRSLLKRQAAALRLPLYEIFLSRNANNDEYEDKMKEALIKFRDIGVSSVAFGDIFLEDLRRHREKNLSKIMLKAVFPIWKRNTAKLAYTLIDLGFKAVTTCVDLKFLGKRFVGRIFDEKFLSELPVDVDPCGEKGEWHTFVYDGPTFKKKIAYRKGEIILRDNRFYHCDFVPV